ncbi:MAG: porin family protein [Saprospiraceae bacterium]
MLRKSSLFITLAFFLSACVLHAQARFGVKAGLNLATVNFSGESADVNDFTKNLSTFQIGGIAEFDFTDNIGLGVGLQLQGRGVKLEQSGFESTLNPLYIQAPISLYYRKSGFYAGVGPYVGSGVAGKAKASFLGQSESENIKFGNDEDSDLAPLDFGANVELGYEILGLIRLSAGYSLGLANIAPKDVRTEDDGGKNRAIFISAALLFGGK